MLKRISNKAISYLNQIFDKGTGFPSAIAKGSGFSAPRPSPPELFSTLIVVQTLQDLGLSAPFFEHIPNLLAQVTNANGFVHFFFDHSLLVADTDCTAVGNAVLLALNASSSKSNATIDKIVANTDSAGVIEVYEKPAGEHAGRIDANVLVNALYLLYAADRADEAAPSEAYVAEHLVRKKYLAGSRYYPSPDVFLYFLSRLVRNYPKAERRFRTPLEKALRSRNGQSGSFLEKAMRIAACDNINIPTIENRDQLLFYQEFNGGWPATTFFKYGKSSLCFGSEAVSTALVLRALNDINSSAFGEFAAMKEKMGNPRDSVPPPPMDGLC